MKYRYSTLTELLADIQPKGKLAPESIDCTVDNDSVTFALSEGEDYTYLLEVGPQDLLIEALELLGIWAEPA